MIQEFHVRIFIQKNWNLGLEEAVTLPAPCGIIHDGQDTEARPMSTDSVCIHWNATHSFQSAICNNMDEPWRLSEISEYNKYIVTQKDNHSMLRLHEDSKGQAPSHRQGGVARGWKKETGGAGQGQVSPLGGPSVLGATAQWVGSKCRFMYLKTCQEGGSYVKCPCHTQNMTTIIMMTIIIIMKGSREKISDGMGFHGRDDGGGLGGWPFPPRSSSVCTKRADSCVHHAPYTKSSSETALCSEYKRSWWWEIRKKTMGPWDLRAPWHWPCFLKFMQMFGFSQPCNQ